MIHIYTDGACKGNPGKGGWGVYWKDLDSKEHEHFGGENATTNNRMEMTAVIFALETVKQPKKIYTDSQYVFKGITEWLKGWKQKNWVNSQKKPVLNRDLWEKIDLLVQNSTDTEFFWVKAHNGDPGNEKADWLANKGVELLKN